MKIAVRLLILAAIALAVVPVDPDKRAEFLRSANDRLSHAMTTCQRQPDLCQETADQWRALAKVSHRALTQTFTIARLAISSPDQKAAPSAPAGSPDMMSSETEPTAPLASPPETAITPVARSPIAALPDHNDTLVSSDHAPAWQVPASATRATQR